MKINPASARPAGESNRIFLGSVVEYEQHGKPYLAIVLDERKGSYAVVNEKGQELTLSPDRIFLLPLRLEVAPHQRQASQQKLLELLASAEKLKEQIDLGALWELLSAEKKELSEKAIAQLLYPKGETIELLAVRRALVDDELYFKRRKTGYEPRPVEVVTELRVKAEADALRAKERVVFAKELLAKLRGAPGKFERNWNAFGVSDLERLASDGSQSPSAKETTEFLDELNEKENLGLTGKPYEKAFRVLVQAGHFTEDEDLNLFGALRPIHFPPSVIEELQSLVAGWEKTQPQPTRQLTTVTIDSESTKDVDDALSIEETPDGYRIGIHISDVAGMVLPGSKLETQAFARATSLYAPDYQIPMFPPELSERLLSLIEGEVRSTMSFYLETDKKFEIRSTRVERESLRITKRLSYNSVDRILMGEEKSPFETMLLWLWDAASTFESRRMFDGALQFPRREMFPRVSDGVVTLDRTEDETPARKLVSEMMIAANLVAATYAKNNGIALSFRSQEAPECDILSAGGDVPEGPAREFFFRGLMKRSVTSTTPLPHSGLGIPVYAQVTSPIRRMLDLLNQRQIANHLATGLALYTDEEFRGHIEECEKRVDETNFLQRQRTRYWLLRYLEQHQRRSLDATIVRVEHARPLVEVEELMAILPFHPAKPIGDYGSKAESRLGHRIRLRIQKLNAREDKLQLVEESGSA